jgi:hypothetical protein
MYPEALPRRAGQQLGRVADPQAAWPQPPAGLTALQRHDKRWKRYEKPQPGHRVQLDVTVIQPLPGAVPNPGPRSGSGARRGKQYYQFTAIDEGTRLRVLRIYDRCNQQTAIQFLDYLLERLPFRVEVIQTDNGAEFQSSFHWPVLDRGIGHVSIKPHTPS